MDEIKQTKKYRGKIIVFFLLIFIGLGAYGYFWYSGIIKTNKTAQSIISENATLKEQIKTHVKLGEAINSEKNRCQEFISQKEGDFGDFEYCKEYINWAQKQNID
ncbi:MAG: hypothetical protein KAI79_01315 [Bacteroidales bacterium]|nr:hypothetical protein [Bacteroidales bacterium]